MANLHPWPRSGNTIDFIQHVSVGPSFVWEALTSEEKLQKWLKVTSAVLPLVEGEKFEFSSQIRGRPGGAQTNAVRGTVVRVVPEKLLALNWRLLDCGLDSQLSIQIQQSFAMFGEERGAECDIWLIHSGFPTEGIGLFEFDGYFRHWRQAITELAALLEKRPGKPTPYALAGLQFIGGVPGIGILVRAVAEHGPADAAGIRPGDIIESIDGKPIGSLDEFHDWIDECVPGDTGIFQLKDRQVEVQLEDVNDARERLQILQNNQWVSVR